MIDREAFILTDSIYTRVPLPETMATWRCERCGRTYETRPGECTDCGHAEFDHGSAIQLQRPGASGSRDVPGAGELTGDDWWRYALLLALVSSGLLLIIGLLL